MFILICIHDLSMVVYVLCEIQLILHVKFYYNDRIQKFLQADRELCYNYSCCV